MSRMWMPEIRYLSVCSGIEAASVAWEHLGWTPLAFSEVDRFASQVLAHRYPEIPNLGDMTKFREWNIDRNAVNLLVGGTPCQSFSVAGLRKGLEDPRGNLALTFISMVDHYRPEWVIWENVPGVLSSSGGRDFGSFIGALGQLGYGFAYRVLDAQFFGVPQRRRRVFVVGHSSGDSRRAAEVLFEPESLSRNHNQSKQKGKGIAAGAITGAVSTKWAKGTGGSAGDECYNLVKQPILYQSNQTDARLKEEPYTCQTVLARWGTGGGNTPLIQAITFQPGNLRRQARANPSFTTTTTSKASSGDQTPHVAIPIQDCRPIDKGQNGLGIGDEGDPSYTLDKMATQGVAYNMAVRRLTPTECERLQGFPDGWTNIKNETPDGSRYKAIGNSMAVPVMRWIGERINRARD
jgi:DNA (cytosine-5)-methyltransferase 1